MTREEKNRMGDRKNMNLRQFVAPTIPFFRILSSLESVKYLSIELFELTKST